MAAPRRTPRRQGRGRDIAFWAVIATAAIAAIAWLAYPDWSPRGGDEGARASAVAATATPPSAATAPATTEPVPATAGDTHERDHGLSASGAPARAKVTVPVLMYHRVAPMSTATNSTSYGLTVTPAQFRQQMGWLKRNGYTAISQAELFRAIQDGAALPRKPVLITVDDGYVDAVTSMLPVLEPLGWPATFFIITSRIGERAFLDGDQLKRLDRAGMDIGSHTVDHLELPSLDEASRMQQLRTSRSTLEKLLGHPVRWFCYPAGRNDAASAASVAKAGYLLGYTTEGGSVLTADALTQLPRVRVSGGQSLDSFAASVRAASAAR